MPALTIVIDERSYRALALYSGRAGRTMEDLAAAAVETWIVNTPDYNEVVPPHLRGMRRGFDVVGD